MSKRVKRWQRPLPLVIAAVMTVACAAVWWMVQRWPDPTVGPATGDRVRISPVDSGNNENVSKKLVASPAQTQDTLPLSGTRFKVPEIEAERYTLDPALTGWDTEVFHDNATAQLKTLAHLLERPQKITVDDVSALVTADFTCPHLRPKQLQPAYRDEMFEVRRFVEEDGSQSAQFEGAAGFVNALSGLQELLSAGDDCHVKLKQFRIDPSTDAVGTTVLLRASTHTPEGPRQINATWSCRWTGKDMPGTPQLLSIEVLDHEEVSGHGIQSTLFRDATASVLGNTPSFQRQLSRGLDYWLQRISRVYGMYLFARNGLAVGDADGDGRDDVYVCQAAGLPNRLFVRREDGSTVDVSHAAGVDLLDNSSSALFIDIDNDGDQDLIVAVTAGLVVLQNHGQLRFKTAARLRTDDDDGQSLTATDYDLDGDLDLYYCQDFSTPMARPGEERPPFAYHDANDGGANVLFRNDGVGADGKLRFVDATRESGLDQDNRRHSLASSWEDYDRDGDPDLYVANDYGRNCLYRNDDGRFVNIAEQAKVVDYGSGMSAAWGDYDRDGNADLYVGNMFSSAGNRITRQEKFQIDQADDSQTLALYQRFAKGNSLYRNLGESQFEEVSAAAGVEIAGWAWGSIFVDVNNDGWEDLLVANGYITTEDTGDL